MENEKHDFVSTVSGELRNVCVLVALPLSLDGIHCILKFVSRRQYLYGIDSFAWLSSYPWNFRQPH